MNKLYNFPPLYVQLHDGATLLTHQIVSGLSVPSDLEFEKALGEGQL